MACVAHKTEAAAVKIVVPTEFADTFGGSKRCKVFRKNLKLQTNSTMKKLLALLAITVCAVSAQAGEFPDISVAEVKAAIEAKKATVIDVNGTDSFKKGHVPSAIDFASKKAELAKALPADKDALVIAYCGGPTCGAYAAAAKAAKELGYTNVKHMSAGISGWMQAGEKTEKATN